MSMTGITVYADFNNCDIKKRVRLNTHGTIRDLEKLRLRLHEGMTLQFSDGELIGEGAVTFSEEEAIWVASMDWDKVVEV